MLSSTDSTQRKRVGSIVVAIYVGIRLLGFLRSEVSKRVLQAQLKAKAARKVADRDDRLLNLQLPPPPPAHVAAEVLSIARQGGATALAAAIKARKLTSVQVVGVYVHRAKSLHATLNTNVDDRYLEALQEAVEADEVLATGGFVGLLHGVPFSVKDCLNLHGMDSTIGSAARCFDPSAADAIVVRLLREQGAIPFVHTNVSQCMMLPESNNDVWGATLNPWDQQRTPGGSSGGEAALIAAQGSPVGLGTDIGGSVRIPAHFCGLASFKPTPGRVSVVGLKSPRRTGMEYSMGVIPSAPGPLSMRVEDCITVMRAWCQTTMFRADPIVPPVPFDEGAVAATGSLRYGFFTDDGFFEPHPACSRAVTETCDALRRAGHTVVPFVPPNMIETALTYFGIMSADGNLRNFVEGLNGETLFRDYRNLKVLASMPLLLRRTLVALSRRLGQQRVADILNVGGAKTAYEYQELTHKVAALQIAFVKAMDAANIDAIVCPGFALPALPHGTSKDLSLASSYTLAYNLLKLPAGSVPVTVVKKDVSDQTYHGSAWHYGGRDKLSQRAETASINSAGCPIGVQVVTRPMTDELCLNAMLKVQSAVQFSRTSPTTGLGVDSKL